MKKIEEIDQMIDWFEKNNPDRGKVIRIDLSPMRLARALKRVPKDGKAPPHEQVYRARTLVAVGRDETP